MLFGDTPKGGMTMNNISKVSDITYQDCVDYMRIDEVDSDEIQYINNLIGIAKTFITNNTGRTDLDEFQDFVIVVFILVQDMYDNRALYVDKTNLNKVCETILGMHRVNLL